MPTIPLVLNVLAGSMLIFGLLILGRMRLFSMVWLFAAQSFLLAVYASIVAVSSGEFHLLLTAFLTFLVKTVYIPYLLHKTSSTSKTSNRLQAYLRPASQLFVGVLMTGFSFYATRSLVPSSASSYLIAAVSVAMVLLGVLMLVIRTGMYDQIIGFLMMENGIFTFGLSLTGGMPLLVELGIFFDILVGSVLMAGLSYRVQTHHGSVVTDRLSELVD